MAANDPLSITPFRQFLDSLGDSRPDQYVGGAASRARDAAAVAEMRDHIVRHYRGVEAQHSFVDENGSIFDCIPIEQQPALRAIGARAAAPPDLPQAGQPPSGVTPPGQHIVQLHADFRDRHGNRKQAPSGTIPMRRLTVENLARFETLQHFFKKSPYGSARPPRPGAPPAARTQTGGAPPGAPAAVPATHRWAHAYQAADNVGGRSFLNIWRPAIAANQVFSLSQHWYTAGSDASLQTAEVGWQVFPQMYGNTNPVFFIYWTADGYDQTGCYNLSCGAFVQTSGSWAIGGALPASSVPGGQQQELEVAYYLSQGNWWLFVGGGASSNAVGYYPTSLYRGGGMAQNATEIDYGGEVVGTISWPPMGSGALAAQGYRRAAYQRGISYYPPGGGAPVNAGLTPTSTSTGCFSADLSNADPSWNTTLYFGGPGGSNC